MGGNNKYIPYTTHNSVIMSCFSLIRQFYKRFKRIFVCLDDKELPYHVAILVTSLFPCIRFGMT